MFGIVVMAFAIVVASGSFSASAVKVDQAKKPRVWNLTKLLGKFLSGSDKLPLSGEQMLETFGPRVEKEIPYLKRYEDDGDVTAATLLGNTYNKLEMHKWVVLFLRVAADAGDTDSQLALGLMYYRGESVARNLQLALTYYKDYLNATEYLIIQGVVGGIYYELGGADNFKRRMSILPFQLTEIMLKLMEIWD